MGVGTEQLQVISTATGKRVPEIPIFANQQAFDNWWNIIITPVPPRFHGDPNIIAVVKPGGNNPIKRFPTIIAAQRWVNQLHAINLYHGEDLRHKIPGYGFLHEGPE